jgi:hypothetical protein
MENRRTDIRLTFANAEQVEHSDVERVFGPYLEELG